MGYRISWLAVRETPIESVLGELKLRRTGERDTVPDSPFSALAVGEWLVIFANDFGYIDRAPISKLSESAEVITCAVNETVGMSSAAGHKQGKRQWSILHDVEQGDDHLETIGKLPRNFAKIKAQHAAEVESDEDDSFFDLPIEVAKSLTGFRHDEWLGDARFECLERILPEWSLSSEANEDIPLPPAESFSGLLDGLNARSNSFYILSNANSNYIQCGGSKKACTVEFRVYKNVPDDYTHYVVGRAGGSKKAASVKMSNGIVKLRESEILDSHDATELFGLFLAGKNFPDKYSVRKKDI